MQAIEEHLPLFRQHFDRLVIPYTSQRACVIIEPREHEHLELAIKNVMYFVSERKESQAQNEVKQAEAQASPVSQISHAKKRKGKKKVMGDGQSASIPTANEEPLETSSADILHSDSSGEANGEVHTDWALYIFHSKENEQYVMDLIGDNHLSQVHLVCVSSGNLTIRDYCFLLTSEMFWNHIDSEVILIFQTDTYLRKHGIDEFVDEGYAMIGAPWRDWHQNSPRQAGNGGLSLRKKSAMLGAIRWSDQHAPYQAGWNEDVFYHTVLEHMMQQGVAVTVTLPRQEETQQQEVEGGKAAKSTSTTYRIKLATKERAKQFSVETLYYDNPLGVHKYWNYLPDPEGHLARLQI